MRGDTILIIWLLLDVVVSIIVFGVCTYLVFWKGHSGWWFILAFLLACSFGGNRIYDQLYERVKTKGERND